MIHAAGSLAYAHARIGARRGARVGEATWRRIEATRGLAGALGVVQSEPALARWVEGLTASADPHAIEAMLRRRWQDCVEELARWMPQAWQAAVRWCAGLADLALVDHLARGEPAPRWLGAADAASLAPLLAMAAPEAPDATRRSAGRHAVPGLAPGGAAMRGWIEGWRRRAPPGTARAEVESGLGAALGRHVDGLAAAGADTAALRRALQAQLVRELRRGALQPAGAFCYLGLAGLELLRLRGELVARAALPRRRPRAGRPASTAAARPEAAP
jgi:hypothetical protein